MEQNELFDTGIKSPVRSSNKAAISPGSAICQLCNKEFPIKIGRRREGWKKQIYCSKKCRHIAQHTKEAARQPICLCKGCGKEFRPKRADRKQFCGRECGLRFKKKTGIIRKLIRLLRKIAKPRTPCRICGSMGSGLVLCSRECKLEYQRQVSYQHSKTKHGERIKPCKCMECGVQFYPQYGDKKRNYCSIRCSRRRMERIGKAARRSRIYGNDYESFDPFYVFRRDKWMCQICGVKTPQKLRGRHETNAPELDHIVPLALGGKHSTQNTQCSCRRCNQNKRTSIRGQLRLCG